MRRISFIIAILGIFVLILLIWLIPEVKINSKDDLSGLVDNQRVRLSGFVEGERNYEGILIFYINGIKVVCSGCDSLEGREIEINGIVEEYEGKKEVEVLEISILD